MLAYFAFGAVGLTLAIAPFASAAPLRGQLATQERYLTDTTGVTSSHLDPSSEPDRALVRSFTSEPFGLHASEVVGGTLVANWRGVAKQVAAEAHILAACRRDRAGCPSQAALRFLTIIETARSRVGRARLGELNRAINLAIRPMSDLSQYGVPDFWSSPLSTIAAGSGDCEDYAIAKYVALQEIGVADQDLRLVIVRDTKLREDHAIITARLAGRWLVLDNRRLMLLEDTELPQYVPVFAINNVGVKKVVAPAN